MIGRTIAHYRILEKLGEGGMGVVYKAEDTRLKRFVALKFLTHAAGGDQASRRFVHEAQTVSSLEHPHICAIHEIDETADGQMFLVMPCYDGEALRAKIDHGPLPVEEAVEIARQIASGLARTHSKGIVHRDVKPANILITQDGVKIVDFGLAKLRTQTRLTREGTTVGTVMYMSPEQAGGQQVDERSDIWSLGVILYEMLAGRPPFTGEHEQAVIYQILNESPQRLRSLSSGVPEVLERIVMRALTKNPGSRYQKMAELLGDLDRVSDDLRPRAESWRVPERKFGWKRTTVGVAGLAILGALALGPGRALWQRGPASAPGNERSVRIAVLPFDNQGAEADEYFTAGITDEVRARLTRVSGLSVIARTSSNEYRKTKKTPQEISKELGVEYLLTGAVRFATEADGTKRVRVSPELVVGASAESKWAQPFDATLTDVFRVQGEIAAQVAQALDLALSPGSKKELEEKPTQNMAAYEAYLRGEEASQALAANDPPSVRVAIEQYERAVALDDNFLEAWARLSRASTTLYINGQPVPALASRARESAEKAVALDPERPEGHLALGIYYTLIGLDYARALSEIERARALAPGDAEYGSWTIVEQSLGRWEEALRQLEAVRRLDPRSVVTLRRLGDTALWLRRTTEAREAMDAALALEKERATVEAKAMTYLQEGDLAGARAVLSSAAEELEPTSLVAYTALYWDLVWALDEAQQSLLLRLSPSAFDNDRGGWGLCLAQAYELRHDETNMRKYAEIAYTAFAEQLAKVPEDAQRTIMVGLTLAYMGKKQEAIENAERAVQLLPVSKDAWLGPYLQHQLVRVYILTGEHENALDQLEKLMRIPYYLTPRWLAIDPTFTPLRGNPRFEQLLRLSA